MKVKLLKKFHQVELKREETDTGYVFYNVSRMPVFSASIKVENSEPEALEEAIKMFNILVREYGNMTDAHLERLEGEI